MNSEEQHAKILIVEDRPFFLDYLKELLQDRYNVSSAETYTEARSIFHAHRFDLVLLDLGIPRDEHSEKAEILGYDLLKEIKRADPFVEVIILSGTSREIDSAIRAIKEGAYYFLLKDDKIFEKKLLMTIQKALEVRELYRQNESLIRQAKFFAEKQKKVFPYLHPDLNYHFGLLLGESQAMQRVYETIAKLSHRRTEEPVLITGESGTGKELVALSIHTTSPRGERPWIPVNLSAIPKELIESELFGIEDMVATGVKGRIGYFEQADGTTIFLDEIGEVNQDIQVKLLRALQEREIRKVGSTKSIPVDVRVISATNKDLSELIKLNLFREDLFYRLNVIPIHLPPLRERKEDIPILIQHYLYQHQQEERNPNIRIAEDAIELLQEYFWKGNIRELRSVIKNAVILRNQDTIYADDFLRILPNRTKKLFASNSSLLKQLPLLDENGQTDFKRIEDSQYKNKVFLRVLIDHEGLIENVLGTLDISRVTGYKYLDEAKFCLLSSLCHVNTRIDTLAQAWGVEAGKLEKTIRRANRLLHYLEELEERFAGEDERIAAYLNVSPDQLRQGRNFLRQKR